MTTVLCVTVPAAKKRAFFRSPFFIRLISEEFEEQQRNIFFLLWRRLPSLDLSGPQGVITLGRTSRKNLWGPVFQNAREIEHLLVRRLVERCFNRFEDISEVLNYKFVRPASNVAVCFFFVAQLARTLSDRIV